MSVDPVAFAILSSRWQGEECIGTVEENPAYVDARRANDDRFARHVTGISTADEDSRFIRVLPLVSNFVMLMERFRSIAYVEVRVDSADTSGTVMADYIFDTFNDVDARGVRQAEAR